MADLQKLAKYNDNNRYLVTCIDVFSKLEWIVPIQNKKSETVLDAFKTIIESSKRTPNLLQSDQETEFLNAQFKEFLSEIVVGFYYVNSELKASVIERFNRTIKEKNYKYFTLKNTERYIDILDTLVNTFITIHIIVEDLNREEIEGVFYEPELQKVYLDNEKQVIKDILKTRTANDIKQYFVSFKGYPDTFNSWVTEAEKNNEFLYNPSQ